MGKKKKENIKIIIDPKTEQFFICKLFFVCFIALFLIFLLSACFGNKHVEKTVSEKRMLNNPFSIWESFKKNFATTEQKNDEKKDNASFLTKTEKNTKTNENFLNFSKKIEKKQKKTTNDHSIKKARASFSSLMDFSNEKSLVKKMKELMYWRGNYTKAVAISEKSQDLVVVYYRGLAYYAMMLSKTKYPQNQRKEYFHLAITHLKKAQDSPEYELKARAMLWKASALDVSAHSSEEKVAASQQFLQIHQQFTQSHIANDALLYQADSLVSLKQYGKALNLYQRLLHEDFTDKVVYDRHKNLVISQKETAKSRISKIKKLNPALEIESIPKNPAPK